MRSQLCLVVACLLTSAFAYPEALYKSFDALEYRALKAAKSHADVLRRSDDIVTKKAIVLTYADGNNPSLLTPFRFTSECEHPDHQL